MSITSRIDAVTKIGEKYLGTILPAPRSRKVGTEHGLQLFLFVLRPQHPQEREQGGDRAVSTRGWCGN